MIRRESHQFQAPQHVTPLPRVAMVLADVGMRHGSAWTLVAREATHDGNNDLHGRSASPMTDALSGGTRISATLIVVTCLKAPNASLQTPHESLSCACAGGVSTSAGGLCRDHRLHARDTAVSAGMHGHTPRSRAVSARLHPLIPRGTSVSPQAKGLMLAGSVVLARGTGNMPGLYPVSPRPSLVGRGCVFAGGGCDRCLRACNWYRPKCMQCRRVSADASEKPHRTWRACNPPFGAIYPSLAPIADSRGTIHPGREASTWECFVRNADRMAFVSVRRLARERCADLWLAHVGPQTGHELAQACPSKHPDGYREALFRRRSI
jgi:hypothetical protein